MHNVASGIVLVRKADAYPGDIWVEMGKERETER